jgi:hypothetical protein
MDAPPAVHNARRLVVQLVNCFRRISMNMRFIIVAGALAILAMPVVAAAQGVVSGAQQGASQGAREGSRAAGPVGGVVGGAVGTATGAATGAAQSVLGVPSSSKKPKKKSPQ